MSAYPNLLFIFSLFLNKQISNITGKLMTNKARAAPTVAKEAVVEEHSVHLLSGVCATVGYTPREREQAINQNV